MKAQRHLRVCACVLALLGFWSVTLTEYFSHVWPAAATAMVVAGCFYEGPRKYRDAYRRVWMLLGVCMLLFFPLDVMMTGNLLLPAVHLSMFVQAYLLLNPKTIAVYRRIFVVSFAQLLASTNLTNGITFAAILAAYCITAVYGAVLIYLQRGMQMSDDVGILALDRQDIPRRLFASSIVFTMILLPLTLGFFYSAPRLQYAVIARGRPVNVLNQMNSARQRTGFTRTVQLGTFGRIQEDHTLALRVEIPADSAAMRKPLRWRGGALNIYDGMTWSSSRDYFTYYNGIQWETGVKNAGMILPRKRNFFIFDERYVKYESVEQLDADPRLLKQVFYLEVPFSENIFGAGEIKAVQGPFVYGIGQDFNASYYMNSRQGLPELITYTVYSVIEEPDVTKLRQAPFAEAKELLDTTGLTRYVRTHYLQLPPSLNPRVVELALEVTKEAHTPYDKVNAIKNYLESRFTYSLDLDRPITDDPLYDFLFVSRTGHCEYFATAMTLMTRIIGIPARLAKGFQKGEWNDAGGFYEVRQRDAHAWTEVYFPAHGWVAFDPSPRAAADEYFERQRSSIARALSQRLVLARILWRRHIVGYNELRRVRLLAELKELLFRETPKTVVGLPWKLARIALNLTVSQWIMAATIVTILTVAVFVFGRILLLPIFSWPKKRSRRRRYGAAFYERMLNMLEKRKIVKPASLTPLEFLDSPALREHPMFTDIEALTSVYYRARFGSEALAENETAAISDILRRLRRTNGRIGHRQRIDRA